MAAKDTFEGWVAHGPEAIDGKMQWGSFTPKPWEEDDVDIEVECCGVCGSELHVLRSGWFETPYPMVVGHEVIGKAVRVGKNVKDVKVGDRVGVGAQSRSCLKADCEECSSGVEHHCQQPGHADTYASVLPDGSKTYGGYANHIRIQGHWAIPIPEALPSNIAAPMLCGGVTSYSPLRNNGAGPGKKVGIVGVGGLGHFGVMFARHLFEADEVVAISRTSAKKEDAMKMGATKFIATDEEKDFAEKNAQTLDLIVSTVSSPDMPLAKYLQMLRFRGRFVQVGAPDDPVPSFSAFSLIGNQTAIAGSKTGSVADIKEMLDLVVKKGVKTWAEPRDMSEANQTILDLAASKARYRYVLVNTKQGGKL